MYLPIRETDKYDSLFELRIKLEDELDIHQHFSFFFKYGGLRFFLFSMNLNGCQLYADFHKS